MRQYKKHNIEEVRGLFALEDYILLDDVYKNTKTKLNYRCPNDHIHKIALHRWLYGRRCPFCSKKAKRTLNDVKSILEKSGYSLISKEYTGAFGDVWIKCPNGHMSKTSWHRLSTFGTGCFECKRISMVGHGNANWKGGKSMEPYCELWKDQEFKQYIKARDGERCINPYCSSKDPEDLTIHHIDYNKKNCKQANLVTICRSCNSKANFDREWHTYWYTAVLSQRYFKEEITYG